MNIDAYKAHTEAFQGIAKNLGDTVDELLKEKAELEARLAEAEESQNTWEEWAKEAWDDIGNLQDERRELISRAEKAEAQNKRLRAALEKIVKHDFLAEQDKTGMTLMSQVGLIREMAKAALVEQPAESDPYSAGEIVADARRARRNHQKPAESEGK